MTDNNNLQVHMTTTSRDATGETGGKDNSGPRSLMRILRLFETLGDATEGMSLADLSLTLQVPKSSLLTLLRPLVAEGYL
ncbi:helix-turn-helix domain-containing protein, partial [Acinetobacter baumannii]